MKITRTKKITASSVDKRLSFTSTKYKGYRISLDHKNNCYNIYDTHGELEDAGFTSQLAAKEAIDKLVKDSAVNSSRKITAGSMPYVKWVKKAEDGSWVMWGGSNSPDIDPNFLDRINHPNYPNPEYNIENQYTDYTVLPAGQSPVESAQEINLPGYAVQWVSGYAGNGVNHTERKYFRTEEERDEFVEQLESNNVVGIKKYTFENYYHTLPAGQSPEEVNASKKITAGSIMYEDMDGSMAGEVGEYLSLEDLVDMYDDLKYYDPVVQQYDSFEDWLRDTVNSGYLREVYSSKKITSDEDIEYLDNQETLSELIDELASSGVDIYDAQEILQALGADYGYDRDDQFAILEDIQEYVGKGINSAEEIDDDELETTEQEFTSKDTSINSSKLPAIYKLVNFPKGSVVLDFGGGRYDNGVEYLNSIGCEGYVYDPYNRTSEHNAAVVKAIRSNGGADIVLNSNVLNVIKEAAARRTVLKNIKKLVKPSGMIYITVYEGNGSGEGKQSKKDSFQLNRKTADYLEEIQEVFPDATRKGKLIVATPNGAPVKSSIQASEDSFMLMNEIMDFLEDSKCEDHQQMVDLVSEHFGFEDKSIADFYVDEYELRYCDKPIAESPYMIKSSQDSVTVGIYGDEVPGFEIVDQIVSYFKSKGIEVSNVSGDFEYGWEMDLTGEPRQLFLAVCNKIPGYNSNSVDEFIEEYQIEDSINGCNAIKASQDSLSSRIFDFLDECGGYTDYNQKIEDVSEEFGMSPDEAEGYVCSWIQNEDAMWHDTADQYEDHDIEESCKVEASYRTKHKNYCPHCTNRTLIEVEDGYYVCDECGAEYKGEPSFEGGLILEDIEESCKVEASLAPFQARELVKEIQDELYNKASEVMQRPEFGFPLEEIADYLVVEVEYQPEVRTQKGLEDHPPRIKCEVRAELSFDALMELADELNPIVEKYSKWAYFDAVTSGIIDAYIELDQIKASTSSEKQPITAGYFDPPEPAEPDTVIVPIEFDNVITLEDYNIASFSEDELFDAAYTDEYDGLSLDDEQGVEEKIGDLVINQLPDEPGNYRISGIANLAYQVSNIFMEHEPPADPDDALGSSWWNTAYAEINYDPRSSYIESLQVEKV